MSQTSMSFRQSCRIRPLIIKLIDTHYATFRLILSVNIGADHQPKIPVILPCLILSECDKRIKFQNGYRFSL